MSEQRPPEPAPHAAPAAVSPPPVQPPPEQRQPSDVSLSTLVITAIASLVAAYLTSLVWPRGALWSAAVTPVLVAIIKESLRRPSAAVSRGAPASKPARRLPVVHHWRLAVATGVAGFLIAAAAFTVSELIAGRAASGPDRATTFWGGSPSHEVLERRTVTVITKTAPVVTVTSTTPTVATPPVTPTTTGPAQTQTTTTPVQPAPGGEPQATTTSGEQAEPAPTQGDG